MKNSLFVLAIVLAAMLASCDVQSGISKQSVEKYAGTPTPTITPTPTEEPVDPADVVQIDTGMTGPTIVISRAEEEKNRTCDKYNRVMLNGSGKVVSIKGACSQLSINGARNEITVEGVAEVVFNGTTNTVRYSRVVNGKRPVVSGNKSGNVIEKASGTRN